MSKRYKTPTPARIRRAFIKEIVNNREDDTPRLIYADWLMDNGEEDLGVFIRHGVENPKKIYTCESDPSVGLFCGNRGYSLCETCTLLTKQGVNLQLLRERRYEIKRGFLTELPITMHFIRSVKNLVCHNPMERVWITDRNPVWTSEPKKGWNFYWPVTAQQYELNNKIPTEILEFLEGYKVIVEGNKYYKSVEEAKRALAEAIPKWARFMNNQKSG